MGCGEENLFSKRCLPCKFSHLTSLFTKLDGDLTGLRSKPGRIAYKSFWKMGCGEENLFSKRCLPRKIIYFTL